jgi:hypothetical protein
MKKILSFALELTLLFIVLYIIATQWILVPDAENFVGGLIFFTIFLVDSALYIILRLFSVTAENTIKPLLFTTFSGGTFLTLVLLWIILGLSKPLPLLWILFLIPIVLFAVRTLIAKQFDKHKQ